MAYQEDPDLMEHRPKAKPDAEGEYEFERWRYIREANNKRIREGLPPVPMYALDVGTPLRAPVYGARRPTPVDRFGADMRTVAPHDMGMRLFPPVPPKRTRRRPSAKSWPDDLSALMEKSDDAEGSVPPMVLALNALAELPPDFTALNGPDAAPHDDAKPRYPGKGSRTEPVRLAATPETVSDEDSDYEGEDTDAFIGRGVLDWLTGGETPDGKPYNLHRDELLWLAHRLKNA